jgi:hypothetical protein
MQSTFEIYSKIKQRLSGTTYNGIELCGPCSAIIANSLYSKKSTRKKLKSAFKLMWREPKHSNKDEFVGDILTWNSIRPDHKKNAEELCERLNDGTEQFRLVRVPDISEDYQTSFSLKSFRQALKITISANIKPKYFFIVLSAVTYTIRYYDSLYKHSLLKNVSKLIAYNSSNIPECFIVSACNYYNVPTYSLQHSLYQDYPQAPPLDVINYENVTAKNLLVWSEFCRKQIANFYKKQQRTFHFNMIIAGHLKNQPQIFCRTVELKPAKILCLLPRDEIESSVALLKLLRNLGTDQDILVRLHPVTPKDKIFQGPLPPNFYLDTNQLLTTTLQNHNIVIALGFNTTSLFEALLFDIPCALFSAPDSTFMIPELPSFSTPEQLIPILEHPQPTPEVAKYILGAHISQYSEIVRSQDPMEQKKCRP